MSVSSHLRAHAVTTLVGAALILGGLASPISAQTVTDADVERASQHRPTITDADVRRAQQRNRMPSESELARIPVPAAPNVDALPRPAGNRSVDLGAVAKGYETLAAHDGKGAGTLSAGGPALLVFVSFSMPTTALSRLVDQAAKAKATIVLRGFVDGSLKETVVRSQRLIGERRVAFQIDPQAFDRFGVERVPALVLLRDGAAPTPCAAGACYDTNAFISVYGDVSLDYALEQFQQRSPSFARDAAQFLQRLKE